MKLQRFLLLAMLLSVVSLDVLSQSPVCSYKYRKRFTFNPALVSGSTDLLNFPVLINISSDADLRTVANSGHVENANGYDIYFTADDGVTRLEYQLQKYTASTGELITWVNVPTLSTTYSTTIYMYYGNTSITSDQSQTSTWNSNFKGVWHLDNNDFSDDSQTGNHATNSGSSNMSSAKIIGGRSFPGTNTNFIQVPLSGMTGGNGQGTVSFWGMVTTVEASTYFFGETTVQTGAGYANRIQLYVGDGAGNLYLGLGGNHSLQTNVQLMATNTWYHIGLSWVNSGAGSGTYSIVVNGVQKGSGAYSGFTAIHSFADLGNDGNASQRTEEITGNMDEVHVSNVARSADWLITEYNNQNNPSAFYTVSSEPKVWLGGTNNNYNSASNWLNNNAAGSGDDVIITSGSNQPTLQGNEQMNGLFIRSGATLSLSNKDLSVRRDITNCGTIAGNTGGVILNSTTSFVQQQSLGGSGTYSLNNLTINNTFSASPKVILNKDVSVGGALSLTSGIVNTTNANILALGTSATSTSGSASSFISGPMTKAGSANFVFPIGKGTSWRRAALSSLSASATFKAEYFANRYVSTAPVNAPLTDVSTLEYWQVDLASGSANAKLSLYWENATSSGINNCPDLTMARWSGTSWDERAATTVAGSSCSGSGTGTITTTATLTAFSPFTFASKSTTLNTLPVELNGFTARCVEGKVYLNWTTASEKNNAYFVPERSFDGNNWVALGQVKGAGSSTSGRSYAFDERDPGESLLYYRITQVDQDGSKKSSNPLVTGCDAGTTGNVVIYPNPSQAVFTAEVVLQGAAEVDVLISDALGRTCWRQLFAGNQGVNVFEVAHGLAPGVYCVTLRQGATDFKPLKLIVR